MSNGEESGNPVRDIRAGLYSHAMTHDGALPPSLQALAEDIKRQGSAYAFFDRWKPFYYVANLTTNDPPRMPIVMSDPKKEGKHGQALLLNGEVLYYRRLDQATVQRMATEPWELVRDSFGDARAFEAFKKRIVLQAPAP